MSDFLLRGLYHEFFGFIFFIILVCFTLVDLFLGIFSLCFHVWTDLSNNTIPFKLIASWLPVFSFLPDPGNVLYQVGTTVWQWQRFFRYMNGIVSDGSNGDILSCWGSVP